MGGNVKTAAAALQLQYSPPQQLVLLLASSPAAPAARPLALRTLGFRLVRVFKRRVVMAARATMFSRNMKLRCSPIASTRDNSTPSIRESSHQETPMCIHGSCDLEMLTRVGPRKRRCARRCGARSDNSELRGCRAGRCRAPRPERMKTKN